MVAIGCCVRAIYTVMDISPSIVDVHNVLVCSQKINAQHVPHFHKYKHSLWHGIYFVE